jgi:hypothetical protein
VYHAIDYVYEAFDTVYVTVPHDSGREITDLENNGARIASPPATLLHDARPNPFNPETTIAYDLATREHVHLMITDVRGARVRVLVNEEHPRGHPSGSLGRTRRFGTPGRERDLLRAHAGGRIYRGSQTTVVEMMNRGLFWTSEPMSTTVE